MRRTELKCTEPERWAAAPASDATDEVIEQYLAHVDYCPFHAALEQKETEAVQRTIEAARSLSESGRLPLSGAEELSLVDNLERYIDFKRDEKRIRTILLRGAGIEDKLLDLSHRGEQISFNVPAPCSIQVLTPDDGSGRELLIATHVINGVPRRDVGPVRSQVCVVGNRSLNFETRPLGGNWCQVAVTAGKLHRVPLADRLRFGSLTSLLRRPIPRIAAITVCVALAVSIPFLIRQGEAPRTSSLEQSRQTVGTHEGQDSNATPPETIPQGPLSGPTPYQVALNDGGGLIGLDGNGKLQGTPASLSPQEQALLEAALRTKRIAVAPLPQELRREAEGRMGSNNEAPPPFTLIGPARKIVLTTTPRFTWNPLAGADSYNVKLFDDTYHFVMESGALHTNSWVVPESKALTPGKIYVWKVVAVKDGAEVSSNAPAAGARGGLTEARFKVLESAKAQEIEHAKRAYGRSHLLLGIVYARAGLLDEAKRELSNLLRSNPKSKVARELLSSVKSGGR